MPLGFVSSSSFPSVSMPADELASVGCLTVPGFRTGGTGTLIHDRVVLTAGHMCTTARGGIFLLGEDPRSPTQETLAVGYRVLDAGISGGVEVPGNEGDVVFASERRRIRALGHHIFVRDASMVGAGVVPGIRLDEVLLADTCVVLLHDGLETRPIQMSSRPPVVGEMLDVGGYGPLPDEAPPGRRRFAQASVTHVLPTYFITRYPGGIDVGGQGHGDSGGPALRRGADGRPEIVGILSGAVSLPSIPQLFAIYQRIDFVRPWVDLSMSELLSTPEAEYLSWSPGASSSAVPWIVGGLVVAGVLAIIGLGGSK